MSLAPRLLAGILTIATAGLGTTQSPAQKPSFSGTWIIQPPNKAAGVEIVVKQDDKSLSLTSVGRTMTHRLDGVEKRETGSVRGGEVVMTTRAVWVGSTIVITTAISYPNMKTHSQEVWSIDAQGQLVIEMTETADGQKAAPTVNRVVHKKKS